MSVAELHGLTDFEQLQYEECKRCIRDHVDSWIPFARAMRIVRDQRLYRVQFKTFDKFVRATTTYGKRWVDRLILAVATRDQLIDEIDSSLASRLTPRHWVELSRVRPEILHEVIGFSKADAGSEVPSARNLRNAVQFFSVGECERDGLGEEDKSPALSSGLGVAHEPPSHQAMVSQIRILLSQVESQCDLLEVIDLCHSRMAKIGSVDTDTVESIREFARSLVCMFHEKDLPILSAALSEMLGR